MKIVIDIPKEFESHFERDRFDESLCRLRTDAHCVAGEYERELCDMLIEAFLTATLLPKGHEYIDRNNAITSVCQWFTTAERNRQFSFTTNLVKQIVADILCNESAIIKADKGGKQK